MKAILTAVLFTLSMSANAGNIDPTDDWNVYSETDPAGREDKWNVYEPIDPYETQPQGWTWDAVED